jgi:phosphoribosylamine--glycine ligase
MENKEQKNGHSGYKKFLFVSHESLSGDLAWHIQKEGHHVKCYIKSTTDDDVYDGILEKIPDWRTEISWADIIVFDDTGFGEIAEKLRKEGKLIVGGSVYTDKLEEDREFGQDEAKKVGMAILPQWNFTTMDDAITTLEKNPGRYVFKPSGFIGSDEKSMLFIAEEEDGKDLLEVMRHNKKAWSKRVKNFQLQKFATGVEVAVGAFFNGKDFVMPVCVNFEHKRMFPGDLGPFTGEMGTLMYYTTGGEIFKQTLEKMRDALAASKYVGYIDVNCIADRHGIHPLEFTSRFGYPTISIQIEGIQTPWGEFLYTLAKGDCTEIKTKKGFQIGVVVAVPPFPFDDQKTFSVYKDSSILFRKPSWEGVHIGDVKMLDEDLRLAGESGYALVITGSGNTVEESRKQAYNRVKNIMLQNMFYRVDIGTRWYNDSDLLRTWGYLY